MLPGPLYLGVAVEDGSLGGPAADLVLRAGVLACSVSCVTPEISDAVTNFAEVLFKLYCRHLV